MTGYDESFKEEKRKRRKKAGNILIIISVVILIAGMIFVCRLPDMMEQSYINDQKEAAEEALEKGYTCYEAKAIITGTGSEGGFDIWLVLMDSGEVFAVLIPDDPDGIYCEGMHASKVDVFVQEDSAEIRSVKGTEVILYKDCYATLDYVGQGAALGGAVAGVFMGIAIFFVFLILFITGILLTVLNRKKQLT